MSRKMSDLHRQVQMRRLRQGSSSCCLHSLPASRKHLPIFCLLTIFSQMSFCELTNAWGQRVRGETWTGREVHPYNTSLSLAVARQQHRAMTVLLLGPSFWMEPANCSLDRNTHLDSRPSDSGSADPLRTNRNRTYKSWFLLVVSP